MNFRKFKRRQIQILKREKSFAEMKTFCSKCLGKDIKLSNFLGGNPSKILILIVLLILLNFCVFVILVLILLEVLFFLVVVDFSGQ